MDRLTQHLLLIVLGGFTLRVALTDAYLAYVQPAFRIPLLIAAVVLLVLGLVGAWRERPRPTNPPGPEPEEHHTGDDHGHHAPRVAWLLLLPVAVLVLVAPPALGAFTAARQAQPAAAPAEPPSPGIGPNDPGEDYRTMPLTNYRLWALSDDTSALEDRRVRLHGFVTPRIGGGWYLTRIQISCCAADAVAYTVGVDGDRGDLAADQWVLVTGTHAPAQPHPEGGYAEAVIRPDTIIPTDPPANTYG